MNHATYLGICRLFPPTKRGKQAAIGSNGWVRDGVAERLATGLP